MCSSLEVTVRSSNINDVSDLLNLIASSTSGKSKISDSELKDVLFGAKRGEERGIKNTDPNIDFDVNLLKSNKPIAQALLAEVNNSLAGYLISRYDYHPWQGNCAFIDDIFVSPEYRKRGVARQLLRELIDQSKRSNLKYVLFTNREFGTEMMKNLYDQGCKWLRNDESDWSVLRIHYK